MVGWTGIFVNFLSLARITASPPCYPILTQDVLTITYFLSRPVLRGQRCVLFHDAVAIV